MSSKIKNIFIIGIAYYLIYYCSYSAYNYMLNIISGSSNLSLQKYSLLDVLQIFEFIGGFYWTNLADRTQKHKYIIIVGLLGYAFFFSAFKFAPTCMKADGLNVFTIFYRSALGFFCSGIFATLDAFCIKYLEQTDDAKNLYGRIRIFACVGYSSAHITLKFAEQYFTNAKPGMCSIYLTIILAVISSFYILIFFPFVDIIENKNSDKNKIDLIQNTRNIKKLLTFNFLLLSGTILLQGIHRKAITTYLVSYFDSNEIKRSKINYVLAARSIPELILFLSTSLIEKKIGIYVMHFLAVFFGILRPISYAYVDLKNYEDTIKTILMYVLEFTNGIFSVLFYYSGVQIANEISTAKTKSLAQGIIYGCYNGLAPCFSGLIGFLLLDKEVIKFKGNNIRGLFLLTGVLGCVGFILMAILIIRNRIKPKTI
ncbi:hypothetical protein COBT_001530 [Conglomerata obtusa]